MKVALLTNGPGELWGWTRPVIAELRKREHSVSLWLLPCQFASGYERSVASGFGVDKLEGPSNAVWTWRALAQEKTDCVIQLGGDLLFGRRIAESSGAPLLCYAYGFKKGMEYAQVFTAYESMAENIGAKLKTPVCAIGDLVKDSLVDSLISEDNKDHDKKHDNYDYSSNLEMGGRPHVLFFPGSRSAIRNLSLKWMTKIARHTRTLIHDVQFTTLFSPFVPESDMLIWKNAGLNPIRSTPAAAMKSADYALTQPGTNTLEMMHCGLPALVAAPFDFLNVMPVSGLNKFASGIPLVGSAFKEWKMKKVLERYDGFMSWPNRIAKHMLLDEIMGRINHYDLSECIAASLKDGKKLSCVRSALLELSGEYGAAARLCDAAGA